MRYYKSIENNYITAIGTGGGGIEITEDEYTTIMSAIQSKPPRTETTDYQLKTDLTWEAYEREPDIPSEELTAEEALEILLGGEAT